MYSHPFIRPPDRGVYNFIRPILMTSIRSVSFLLLFVLSACSSSAPDTFLEVNFELPIDQAFLESIDSYHVQLLYQGGESTGRFFEYDLSPYDSEAGVRYGLLPTEEGESVTLQVEALEQDAEDITQESLVALAASAPFSFNGRQNLNLFLGEINVLNLLSQSMTVSRVWHTVTPLEDGSLLIAGGASDNGLAHDSTALFKNGGLDTPIGAVQATPMITARVHHTATVIRGDPDLEGQVLFVGGDDRDRLQFAVDESSGLTLPVLDLTLDSISTRDTTELYDPESAAFRYAVEMPTALTLHQAVALPKGGVLWCGGLEPDDSGEKLKVSSVCNHFAQDELVFTANLSTSRVFHQLTALDNGMALITGGAIVTDLANEALQTERSILARAELYESSAPYTLDEGSMTIARAGHNAIKLQDGRVLITGGYTVALIDAREGELGLLLLSSSELYTPSDSTQTGKLFRTTGTMAYPRAFHQSILLEDGRVLVYGGIGQTVDSGLPPEIYDPETENFSSLEGDSGAAIGAAHSPLPNGQFLISGGQWYLGDSSTSKKPALELLRGGQSEQVNRESRPNEDMLLPSNGLRIFVPDRTL